MKEPSTNMAQISPKSRLTTTLLAVFLGGFGAHRLYLEKTKTALGMLILSMAGFSILGTVLSVRAYPIDQRYFAIDLGVVLASAGIIILIAVGIWAFVDFIVIVSGKMKDKEGKLIKKW